MFPTSMPRAVTDMKAALRPALEAPECSQRPKSTPAMDKSKKSQHNANRTKSVHLRRSRPGATRSSRSPMDKDSVIAVNDSTPLHSGSSETDRKSVVSGKSVSVRVDLGGRRINKKKK